MKKAFPSVYAEQAAPSDFSWHASLFFEMM